MSILRVDLTWNDPYAISILASYNRQPSMPQQPVEAVHTYLAVLTFCIACFMLRDTHAHTHARNAHTRTHTHTHYITF